MEPSGISLLPIVVLIAVVAAVMGLVALLVTLVRWLDRPASTPSQHAPQGYNVRPVFSQIALERGGRLLPGSPAALPRLTFHHQGVPVVVEAHISRELSPRLHVGIRMAWPDAGTRLEISPQTFTGQLQKLFSAGSVETGDTAFDCRYLIFAPHPARARRLLSPEVRDAIERLCCLGHGRHIRVRIVDGTFLISKRQHRTSYQEIKRLIDLSVQLYDAAIREPLEGIEFTNQPVIDPASPLCGVCGEGIDTPEIMCGSCRTPHHRECWHYYGGCSIYGCGGRRFEPYRVMPARRA